MRPRLTLAREARAEHGIDRARAALQPRQRHQAPVVALGPEARRLGPAGRQRDAEIEQRIPAPDRVQPIPAEGRRVPEPAEVLPIVEGPGRALDDRRPRDVGDRGRHLYADAIRQAQVARHDPRAVIKEVINDVPNILRL